MQQLRFIDVGQPCACLQFQEHVSCDQHVGAVGAIQETAAVHDAEFDLALERQLPLLKLDAKRFFVRPLKEPWPQLAVDLLSGANDRIGQGVVVGPR